MICRHVIFTLLVIGMTSPINIPFVLKTVITSVAPILIGLNIYFSYFFFLVFECEGLIFSFQTISRSEF